MKARSLEQIYQPIRNELGNVEEVLQSQLRSSKCQTILEISSHFLTNSGKRLRPALLLLSAKANQKSFPKENKIINIAAAVELIHMASLIHDDVIDHSTLRRNLPTINHTRGSDVAIVFGDYLYSTAFGLIATCGNVDVLQCISSATRAMCEGELSQVCQRDNVDLLRESYLIIAKKKTAALFASSCQAGGIAVDSSALLRKALDNYGFNFGIAFQIVDDCLDLVGNRNNLGKLPGSDFKIGEVTLPVLNLIAQSEDKNRILTLIKGQDQEGFNEVRQRFINSQALKKTKEDILFYIHKAIDSLKVIDDSCFKDSLFNLAGYLEKRFDSSVNSPEL